MVAGSWFGFGAGAQPPGLFSVVPLGQHPRFQPSSARCPLGFALAHRCRYSCTTISMGLICTRDTSLLLWGDRRCFEGVAASAIMPRGVGQR
jgi:hypothetical protein